MASFKVGDRVRSIECIVVRSDDDGLCYLQLPNGDKRWFYSSDFELVEPAAPDPRDAEIERLKARVAELESRQSDADRAYYRKLVVACLRRSWSGVISIADAVFAEVKRREGGGDSTSERPLQENCKKNFLVRGKNLLGG